MNYMKIKVLLTQCFKRKKKEKLGRQKKKIWLYKRVDWKGNNLALIERFRVKGSVRKS